MSINVEVRVVKNDVATAIRKLKKKCEREGVISSIHDHEYYRKLRPHVPMIVLQSREPFVNHLASIASPP
jgi:ribosomal protein S21